MLTTCNASSVWNSRTTPEISAGERGEEIESGVSMAVAAVSYITATTTTAITIRCPNDTFHQNKKKVGICSQRNSLFSSINNGKTSTALSIVICSASNKPSSSSSASSSQIRHLSFSLSVNLFVYVCVQV